MRRSRSAQLIGSSSLPFEYLWRIASSGVPKRYEVGNVGSHDVMTDSLGNDEQVRVDNIAGA